MPDDDARATRQEGGKSPDVTFVIPSFRAWPFIDDTLRSIGAQHSARSFEVIVVDSSDDDTADRVLRTHPWVRVIHSARRLSPGQARNRGVRQGAGRWLAFVDADVTLPKGWLEALLEELGESGRRLAGAAIANANPQDRPSRVLHWIEFSEFLPGSPTADRRALGSSNLLMRRSDFDGAGGFPSHYRMCEDLIFTSKVGGCRFVADTAVLHRHRRDWPSVREHLERLGYWSGRYRAEHAVRGGFLRRFPILAPGLIPWRGMRIARRIADAGAGIGRFCLDLPWVIAGLAAWVAGFRRGLAWKGEVTQVRGRS